LSTIGRVAALVEATMVIAAAVAIIAVIITMVM
jgi:hypothetical protein